MYNVQSLMYYEVTYLYFLYLIKLTIFTYTLEIEVLFFGQVWYDALDELNYTLPDGDFNQRWGLQFWPSKIEKLVEKVEKTLAADNERYQREMEEEQMTFLVTLENLETSVSAFARYTDLNQVGKIKEIFHSQDGTACP